MNKDLIQQAHRGLLIQDIFLHSGEIKTKDDFYPLSELNPFHIQFRHFIKDSRTISAESPDDGLIDLIVFRYVAGFRVIQEDVQEENVIVEVDATFSACYTVVDKLPDEAITEFAKYNVGFNVWPYWREYASSTAKRLGLPHFAIPLYKLPI